MGLLYFAYGSNMLETRLRARCRGARLIGAGRAPGHDLAFAKRGRDGSGKATLCPGPGALPGVLFQLEPGDLAPLDRAEGRGIGYDRVEIDVIGPDGRPARALSYVACRRETGLLPFGWYLALCVAGAPDPAHQARLAAHPWTPDPDPARPARQAAVSALARAGIADHRAYLSAPERSR
ncbi:gamma-glutamylcyclotransferase family protein [Phaeovulum vinaykumarii]|uniref:Uncharacterized conserved protein YtfP, gamma-glutamylcyclotransferase (GGCT)/AIG2-like family n=1 Tax=Phaeovulum vinaykumarii TaxID=407234 RepID=A0A1N7KUK7_9RHOB|nr:gamma-glutamylcyclotransferase family protein [Phaeovulum vinaykumarii]SIS65227.1 Uncharacterized conserved protein YtfP, gamma-glutamylcyclotransferase (GGCT)/AIG2-like family [Phaeovulum vinaykumarii]SOC01358.1 gamma-glutamylcyclotransferase (GGCT)/AIG2-like uncharacterized protein YtfP [Phaeovulum vinaykumarii]